MTIVQKIKIVDSLYSKLVAGNITDSECEQLSSLERELDPVDQISALIKRIDDLETQVKDLGGSV